MTLQRLGTIPMKGQADVDGILKPGEQLGGTLEYREYLQSIDLASAAASTASSQSLTVTGLAVGDIPLYVDAVEGLTAGVAVVALGPVLAANVLVARVVNPTIAAVDAAAANFRIGVLRPPAPAV